MYPIPANQKLKLLDIANHWSREITPPVTPREVLEGLIKAWWRGELATASGQSRADMLRVLYAKYQDRIAFIVPGLPDPASTRELPDGGVVVFRLWQVPLPNAEPKSWDDANCAEAFEAVAEAWDSDRFEIVVPSVAWIELTVMEFTKWTEANDYPLPTFWRSATNNSESSATTRRITKKKALELAQEYIAADKRAGRTPTQIGLENQVREAGWHGGRERLRAAFKSIQGAAGREVKRGRIPKQR
jgi:hypothetical protein